MNRRIFITQAATSTAVIANAHTSAPDVGEPLPLVTTPPVVMAPRMDGAEIVWGVSRHARGWVEVKRAAEMQRFGGTAFGFSTQSDKALRVRLTGLDEGMEFTYRTVTEAMAGPATVETSEWRTSRTLHAKAKTTHFAVWNDTHLHDDTIAQLHAQTPSVDFLLWNGDICNDWVKDEIIIPALLHPAGTDFTAQRPLVFVWGNHDLRGAYGYHLQDYAASPEGRSYFAFRSGPVAVVCLNTGEDKADAHPSFKGRVACEPLRREQAKWLRDHVMTAPELRYAPYRIVFCHLPVRWKDESGEGTYDGFSKRSRDLWHDALVQWGAQVVISGHTHEHHWMDATKEFPYAQLIGGGPTPDTATIIEGDANATRLRLTMRALDGKQLLQQDVKSTL